MYSSTCFGRPHAHPQELNNCGSSLWFYHWSVVVGSSAVGDVVASGWLIYLNCIVMHGLANFQSMCVVYVSIYFVAV
jgi:hypothetical protein